MHNIPDDCRLHPDAPWNEPELRCPRCHEPYDNTACTPEHCVEEEGSGLEEQE